MTMVAVVISGSRDIGCSSGQLSPSSRTSPKSRGETTSDLAVWRADNARGPLPSTTRVPDGGHLVLPPTSGSSGLARRSAILGDNGRGDGHMASNPNIRRLIADAGFAFLVGIVVALILASLSIAGIINVPIAVILLVVAWVVSIIGTFAVPQIWDPPPRDRIIFSIILGLLLFSVGAFEFASQSSELSHYARFQIEDIVPLPIGDDGIWYINYVGYNRGNEPFHAFNRYWTFHLFHSVLNQEYKNRNVEELKKSQGIITLGKITSQSYPGEKGITSVPISPGHYIQDEVYYGRGVSYIYTRFIYSDKFLPPETVWVTETCIYLFSDHNVHYCLGHNNIYQEKLR